MACRRPTNDTPTEWGGRRTNAEAPKPGARGGLVGVAVMHALETPKLDLSDMLCCWLFRRIDPPSVANPHVPVTLPKNKTETYCHAILVRCMATMLHENDQRPGELGSQN
jgi:hypothetical protein